MSVALDFDVETGAWTEAVTDGLGPSPRFSVAGDCLDYKRGVLVFIGGCNEELEALDDLYYLHTGMPFSNLLIKLLEIWKINI
jgi:hypothetical protein